MPGEREASGEVAAYRTRADDADASCVRGEIVHGGVGVVEGIHLLSPLRSVHPVLSARFSPAGILRERVNHGFTAAGRQVGRLRPIFRNFNDADQQHDA
jgi:hypothetical protein